MLDRLIGDGRSLTFAPVKIPRRSIQIGTHEIGTKANYWPPSPPKEERESIRAAECAKLVWFDSVHFVTCSKAFSNDKSWRR